MSVFNSLYASHYDQIYLEKDYAGECNLILDAVSYFQKTPIRNVIDIGCGTGGHCLELATRGYEVTGIDLSTAMLGQAVNKASKLGIKNRPNFIHGDIRSFHTGSCYDLAIMMFAVVGYLTKNEDVLAGLRNIRSHLSPGGLLMFDFWYGPSVIAIKPSDRIRILEMDDTRVLRASSTTLNEVTHTADVNFKLWKLMNSKLIDEINEKHLLRYFFPQEIKFYLEISGFEVCDLSTFPNLKEPLSNKTWNAFMVARAI